MKTAVVPVETVDLPEAQERLASILERTQAEHLRVVVECNGRLLGAIVSMDDLRRLQKQDADRKRAFEALERIGEAFAAVPPEELEREIERAVAEVREEMRAERAAAAAQ